MTKPQIDNAPGLRWRPLSRGRWQASWKCRDDIAKRQFRPARSFLWAGETPTPTEVLFIQDACQRLQNQMLMWSRGGLEDLGTFDGTMSGLIRCYQTDKDSPYQKIRYKSRQHYDYMCKRLEDDIRK